MSPAKAQRWPARIRDSAPDFRCRVCKLLNYTFSLKILEKGCGAAPPAVVLDVAGVLKPRISAVVAARRTLPSAPRRL